MKWLLALLSLVALPGLARAQNCGIAISDGPDQPDEAIAHVGDTIHWTITMTLPGNSCYMDSGTNWALLPDGSVHVIISGYNRQTHCNDTVASFVTCPGGSPSGFSTGGNCIGDVPTEIHAGSLKFKY